MWLSPPPAAATTLAQGMQAASAVELHGTNDWPGGQVTSTEQRLHVARSGLDGLVLKKPVLHVQPPAADDAACDEEDDDGVAQYGSSGTHDISCGEKQIRNSTSSVGVIEV